MAAKRVVHIIGTGTIGEPLIGLFLNLREQLALDEITFHKNRPLLGDRAKVKNLIRRGAKLVVAAENMREFEKLGMLPTYEVQEALDQATVVIDCTPDGVANQHKLDWFQHMSAPQGFLAQGSETGFGKPYARGINDGVLVPGADRFLQIVSCNTHNLAVITETLALHEEAPDNLLEGRFVCMRRSSDISQEKSFIAAPEVGKHKDPTFGTHHAYDAWRLFKTRGLDLNLFSSAIKLNTQYMHSLWFNLKVKRPVTLEDVLEKLTANPYVALTEKTMANPIFSFGRDHGFFGRILNQTVVSVPTLTVREGHEITGFCFTPQDGNSLLSSIAAAAWLMYPDTCEQRLHQCVAAYLFEEV
jgi:glyceraldehyde-3-phosphate dehydrogenase (NAD(P))